MATDIYTIMSEQVIIIGAGCAGYTAAIYTARANLSPLLITGSQIGGQLTTTTEVENFPGFPDGVMGPDLMFLMQQQAEKFGTRFAYEDVKSVVRDEATGLFTVKTSGQNYETRSIIVATGASARYLGIPGEEGLVGHGLTACATCDGAMFLTRFASRVYLIHRRDTLRASKIMAERTLSNEKIFPMWNSTIVSYKTDDKGELEAAMLKDVVEGDETELPVKCVFMAIGHTPNTSFLGDLVDRDDAGYIIRETGMMATRTPGLFAAGDVADPHYRQAISSAGMGCSAAIEAERYLLGL